MKLKLIKETLENGEIVISTNMDNAPFVRLVKTEEQEIEIDESKWRVV